MRWKFFIPAILITILIIAFNIFFLDKIIAKTMTASLQMAFQSKVEVGNVKTQFKNLSIKISGFKIADKDAPMQNLIEFKKAQFSLMPTPLLSKKILVREMGVTGIAWGTKRKTSGKLPPKKRKKIEKIKKTSKKVSIKVGEKIEKLPAIKNIKNAQDKLTNISVDSIVSSANLNSIKEMDTMKNGLKNKYTEYEKRTTNLNIEQKTKEASDNISDVKNIKLKSPEDIVEATKKLERLNKTKSDLQKTVKNIKTLKKDLSQDVKHEKELVTKIDELRKSDYDLVRSKLNMPDVSFNKISKSLFGPKWTNRITKTIHYIHIARKYMPKKKKSQKKIVKESRSKGMNVSFPKKNNPPDFLIQKMLLSGSTGGKGKAEKDPLDFTGTVKDITSSPALLGKPTIAEISGKNNTQSGQAKLILDHTKDTETDTITILYSGIPIQEFGLPESEYLPSFNKGTAHLTGTLTLTDENLDCIITTTFTDLSHEQTETDETKKMVQDLWEGIEKFDVTTHITGKTDDLKISVSSDLDNLLSARLKNMFTGKIQEIQDKVKAQIDELTEGKKQEVLNELSSQKAALQKNLSSKQKELTSKLDTVKQKEKEIQNKIDERKNRLKKEAEKKKKKLENQAKKELQKKAEKGFKSLFK